MRWSSFLKIAFRNIILHRGFSLVSLIGLSFGIAIALLVLVYVNFETTYDNHYPESERIYRLISHGRIGSDTIQSALTPMPLIKVAADFPGVESITRLVPGSKKLIKSDYARFNESYFYYADKGFFQVFEIPFFLGDPLTAFSDSNAVVISRTASKRFFGTINPIGEGLVLDNGLEMKVTGVYYDLPENTHLRADFIANWQIVELLMGEKLNSDYEPWSNNWFALSNYIYLRVSKETDVDLLQTFINDQAHNLTRLQKVNMAEGQGSDLDKMEIRTLIQPITDIHLNTNLDHEIQKGASSTYVFVFTGIAIFILVITAINFMNLTTARASRRFKEIAIRKTFGAGRRHLIIQFFIESVLFCLLALGLALVFMELFFERFSQLFDISIGKGSFISRVSFGWVLLITLMVGVIAGSYPSFFFSGLRATKIFKGQIRTGRWGTIVRGVLVAFQICIAVALMSVSLGMHNQLKFIKDASLGYDPNHLIAVEREYAFGDKTDSVKKELINRAEIEAVSSVVFLPGEETSILSFKNMSDTSQVVLLATNIVDSLFFRTMGAQLLNGRFFDESESHDSSLVVINESAARMLGFTNLDDCRIEVLGSKKSSKPLVLKIIGVVNDIYYESLKKPVRPMVFMQSGLDSRSEYMLIRFKEGQMAKGVQVVEELWNSVLPQEPIEHFRLSERVDRFYREEQRFAKIGTVLAIIALVFAILGLIGMVSFIVNSKLKNMEISRIMSASSAMILVGAFRGVYGYVFAGVFSSLLISPFVINYWLSGFYYTFTPSGYCLVIPLVLMVMVSFVTVYLVGKRVFHSALMKSRF